MSKLFHLVVSIVVLELLSLTNCYSQNAKQAVNREKPNIIFILTDDQRWDALVFTGNKIIQTPYMDELASSGIYFRNAFVTTPICAASRASLFTGLYQRTHDYTFGRPNLNKQYMYESGK